MKSINPVGLFWNLKRTQCRCPCTHCDGPLWDIVQSTIDPSVPWIVCLCPVRTQRSDFWWYLCVHWSGFRWPKIPTGLPPVTIHHVSWTMKVAWNQDFRMKNCAKHQEHWLKFYGCGMKNATSMLRLFASQNPVDASIKQEHIIEEEEEE